MTLSLPKNRPQLSRQEMHAKIAQCKVDRARYPLLIVGIRGYYRDSMGIDGINDRGLYDDAVFIDTPDAFVSYNGNTDPSGYKKGAGTGAGKGMAALVPGVYFAHQFALHRGKYVALCQKAGPVTVMRDGSPAYTDTGYFGINIHRGEWNSTSSLGCQTIHPSQWDSFIALAVDQARRSFGAGHYRRAVVPYILLDV